MRARPWLFVAVGVLTASGVASDAQSPLHDYPQWRGQNRDGAASGFIEPTFVVISAMALLLGLIVS